LSFSTSVAANCKGAVFRRQPALSVKRLCERTEIFLSALKSLEDPAVATQKEAEFAGLKSVLQSLKKLLSEIQDFVSQYGQDSSLSIARKMAVNDEFRSKRVREISSFNARIHELRSTLLPAVDVSVEKNREEDLEDFRLDMEAILETMMEELTSTRTNSTKFSICLKEIKDNCSEGQSEILKHLLELENKLLAGKKISVGEVAGIENAVNESMSVFAESLKSEVAEFKKMLEETQMSIVSLKGSCDAANVKFLEEMERKFASFQAISVKVINMLKDKVGDTNQALVQKLEEPFASLNVLSMQKDIQDVKTLLQELKESQPASDARVKTWLQQLEDKVNTSATITKEELSKLQSHFASSHGDVMHLLEAKLGALYNMRFEIIIGINQFEPNIIEKFNNIGLPNGICGHLCITYMNIFKSYPVETMDSNDKIKNKLGLDSDDFIDYIEKTLPELLKFKEPLHIQEVSDLMLHNKFEHVCFFRYNNFKNLEEKYYQYLDIMDMQTMQVDKDMDDIYYVEQIVKDRHVYQNITDFKKENKNSSYYFIVDLNGHYMSGIKYKNVVYFIETTDKDYVQLKIDKLKYIFEDESKDDKNNTI
jgi:hypothetical protein